MKINLRLLTYSLTFFALFFSAKTYSSVAFYYYGIENGLYEARIISISQDSTGFIWLTGENSLFRFDGNQFKAYKNFTRNSVNLPFTKINTLFSDLNGTLWVGSNDGIAFYDLSCNCYTGPGGEWDQVRVTDFAQHENGILWISTNEGLARMDTKTMETTWFTGADMIKTEGNNILPSGDIRHLTTQPDGKIWLATYPTGLYLFDPKSRESIDFGNTDDVLLGEFSVSDLQFYENKLFVGTAVEGFLILHPENKKVNRFDFDHMGYNIENFKVESDSILWMATNNGLFKFNRLTGQYTQFFNNPLNPISLHRTAVDFVFIDRDKNLWVSSGIRGISYGLTNVPFSHLVVPFDLLNKEVVSLCFDKTGNLWIGYETGEVEKLLNNPYRKKRFSIEAKNQSGKAGSIMEILEDSKGRIWIGGWECGLQKLNESGTAFEHAPVVPDSLAQLISVADIRDIVEGPEGNIWIAFHGIGLGRYQPETHQLKLFRHNPDSIQTSLSINYVYNMCFDKENNLWIASVRGISRFNLHKESFTNFFNEVGNPNSLSSNVVNTIYCDHSGIIWAGTNNGLNTYSPSTNSFRPVLTDKEIPFLNISDIQSAKPGEIWISTQTGITKVSYTWDSTSENLKIDANSFNRSDGLLSTNYFPRVSAIDNDGIIYFCGNEGIDFFQPDEVKTVRNETSVPIFTELSVNGKPLYFPDQLNNINKTTIELNHNDMMLNIRFSNINFRFGKQQFRYKLEGFNTDWVYPENEQMATFTNLLPGEYIFKVETQKNDGTWSGQTNSLSINVKPPFWATIPFWIGVIILLILVIYLIVYARSKAMLKHQRKLENIIEFRTKELMKKNEELEKANLTKNKFFSIISHDLRSPFSGMLGILDLLTDSENDIKPETQKDLLVSAKTSAYNTFELLENLLIWAHSQMKEIVCKPKNQNLSQLLKKNLELKRTFAQNKKITLHPNFAEDVNAYFDRDMINTVIRNLLNNAIKFTHPGGKVEIKTEYVNGEVVVHIADTGVGLEPEELEKLFDFGKNSSNGTQGEKGTGLGLIISKEFVSSNNGKIFASHNQPIGTVFSFSLPVNDN